MLQLYEEYAPYQFLAYWYELWHAYEQLLGPFRELKPDDYKSFTGRSLSSCQLVFVTSSCHCLHTQA